MEGPDCEGVDMAEYSVAWWNLENLFDVEGSPARPEWARTELLKELKGWTGAVLDRKLSQLSLIIRKINEGHGPDILGVGEVENKSVLERLVEKLGALGRHYAVAHWDTTEDKRAIDVAFIYDADKFSAHEQFSYVVLKRTGTRDLFQVNFRSTSGRRLVIVGNHWPSRTGGQLETEAFRCQAGETLAYWMKRIPEKSGNPLIPTLLLGDFNDEPSDRALASHLLSSNSALQVLNARDAPRVFNLMWTFLAQGIGTHYFNNTPNLLDQILVGKSLLSGAGGLRVKGTMQASYAVRVERYPEMTDQGTYPRPVRFGRPSSKLNETGFSDHFPVSVVLEEI
jgi:endonuclease/exonuclease/phosphatase family metal-dependent hydrolase